MRSALPQFDADRKGAVTFEEFKDKMQMLFDEFLLAEEDTIELFRFFDNDGVGQITFDEFCKAVTSSYTPGMAAILEVDVLSPMDSGTLEKYVQHVKVANVLAKMGFPEYTPKRPSANRDPMRRPSWDQRSCEFVCPVWFCSTVFLCSDG